LVALTGRFLGFQVEFGAPTRAGGLPHLAVWRSPAGLSVVVRLWREDVGADGDAAAVPPDADGPVGTDVASLFVVAPGQAGQLRRARHHSPSAHPEAVVALDEALVQAGLDALPALRVIEEVPSRAPFIDVEGVRVHSGDVLLSRGGAPTSALIARGSDFANTFSHAALLHVDAETGEGTVIESLIEAGSVFTTVDEYLESKKHRILVLRLRPDHPALAADPLSAHRAAQHMLDRVRSEHLPYDFAMDWADPSAAFCSEIIYHAYREVGVELWSMRASMSSPGLVTWLAAMGVREFTTLVPSDAEYDPQLRAVAEWRDASALMEYRLDNAITDALLEEAERGARLGYPWYALPPARLLKASSVARSWIGGTPTIPKGMSASTALRVDALVSRVHPAVLDELAARAEGFREANGREAPYWTLVDLARESLAARRASLGPALGSG
jgi:hypothetical protein